MNHQLLKWVKLRILFTSFGFVLFMGLILFRSYQLQIFENARVNALAFRQYKATLPVQAKRGTIYDRHGDVLAQDVQVASIAIHPHQIEQKDLVAQTLAKALLWPVATVKEKINSTKKFEWLARRVPAETGTFLENLKLKGVVVFPEYKRFYPHKELAGHLLGAVGYDAKALGGLELAFDSYLRSSPTRVQAQKDARGKLFTPITDEPLPHDIYLTLDANVQFIAEKYLLENALKYHVKNGFALVMDPKTAEILAVANYPQFNPNTYWQFDPSHWKNHAFIDTFEPGSTFKAVLAAAALASGTINRHDVFFCENGDYKIGKHVIHDHDSYQNLTFADIIKVSSNIGVTKIAQKIGKESLYDMITKLGFGQPIGLEFPGEQSGQLQKLKNWRDVDLSAIAFGQGLSVSGIQMANAYASFANGGIRLKPFLVSKIMSPDGSLVRETKPLIQENILTSEQALELKKILEGVVGPGGTGRLAKLEGYRVAGKTGTAQKVNAHTKTYDKENYTGSFVGFVPVEDPRFVIYVVYDSPQPIHTGGAVAAPVFKNIARDVLVHRGIPPDEQLKLADSSRRGSHAKDGLPVMAD